MTFEQLALRLSASGRGRTRTARCPNHADTHPSLRISQGEDGKVLLKCMAACETKDVLAAAGLGWSDLFPDTRAVQPGVVAHYYYSENLRKTRLEPKTFQCERYEAGKGWVPGWNGIRPPLYGIDRAASSTSTIVFVVEGEKDVDRLVSLGYTAISAASGANERHLGEKYAEDLVRLKDRHFVLAGDNDAPGFALMEEWASVLQPFAKTMRHLNWRDQVPIGGDVSDYFDQHRTDADFDDLLQQSVSLPVSCLALHRETTNEKSARVLTTLRDLLAEPDVKVDFLVDGLLVAGGTSLLAARPKVGKSTLARFLSRCVATGEPFLGRQTHKGPVILLQFEEHRQFLKEQLRCLRLNGNEEISVWCEPAPPNAMEWLSGLVAQHLPALVVIDPLLKFIRVSDINAYAEVSKVLEPLNALARSSGAHLLLVHHLGKAGASAQEGGSLGSTAIDGLVDAIVTLYRRDSTRAVRTLQRYGADMPETNLVYDEETGFFSVGEQTSKVKFVEVQESISNLLRGGPALTEGKIRSVIRGDTGAVGRAIRELVGNGLLIRTGPGHKGEPFKYSLRDDESESFQEEHQMTATEPEVTENHSTFGSSAV